MGWEGLGKRVRFWRWNCTDPLPGTRRAAPLLCPIKSQRVGSGCVFLELVFVPYPTTSNHSIFSSRADSGTQHPPGGGRGFGVTWMIQGGSVPCWKGPQACVQPVSHMGSGRKMGPQPYSWRL